MSARVLALFLGMVTAFTAAAETFTVNSTGDAGDASPGDGKAETAKAGEVTLRSAIEEANASAGKDVIHFDIPGDGPHEIAPQSPLPQIVHPIEIDGTTQPGTVPYERGSGSAQLMVVLCGRDAGDVQAMGLYVTGGNSTIIGLNINGFKDDPGNPGNWGHGIVLDSSGNTVKGCLIGTDQTGLHPATHPNEGAGIGIWNVVGGIADNNIVGGGDPIDANVISGNGDNGVYVETGNFTSVQGNLIGTDALGENAIANGWSGVALWGAIHTLIGGDGQGEGNVISGNAGNGIYMLAFSNSTTIGGNRIGTSLDGESAIANTLPGIWASDCDSVSVGGITDGARNVISGNGGGGVSVTRADNWKIEGNYIGLNAAGDAALTSSRTGIRIDDNCTNMTIGGAQKEARNIISGNEVGGIDIALTGINGVTVAGNTIGLDASGSVPVPNGYGILVDVETTAAAVVIGGNTAAHANTITGNALWGIRIAPKTAGIGIYGNIIGLDPKGNVVAGTAHGNGEDGIYLRGNSCVVGVEFGVGRANIIGKNGRDGIRIEGAAAHGNFVSGNYIGIASDGKTPVGNIGDGIAIIGARENRIGRGIWSVNPVILEGRANVISGNGENGIHLYDAGNDNTIVGNFVGTDEEGFKAVGNAGCGIQIMSSSKNQIGEGLVGENWVAELGNVISGNQGAGISIEGTASWPAEANQIFNNAIGPALGGGPLTPTTNDEGIELRDYAVNTAVGGKDFTERNNISYNRGNGITLYSAAGGPINGNHITGNEIHYNGGRPDAPGSGIFLFAASENVIGLRLEDKGGGIYETVGEGNSIMGNSGHGVFLGFGADGNHVYGNAIGSSGGGNALHGVSIAASDNNLVGSPRHIDARNVISANGRSGVHISGGTGADASTGNVVAGNWIGTDDAGTTAVPNRDGVTLAEGATANTIGHVADRRTNATVISGNAVVGVKIETGADRNKILGCLIGVDATGLKPLGQGVGVQISGGSENDIGGPNLSGFERGNTVSGNISTQIVLRNGPDNQIPIKNAINGNYIGLGMDGATATGPGAADGVRIEGGAGNWVGDGREGSANTISALDEGVSIESGKNMVYGNTFGTTENGTGDRGNGTGIVIRSAPDTLVGSQDDWHGNEICHSRKWAMELRGKDATGTMVLGNSIGTDDTSGKPRGNRGGILIVDAGGTTIGEESLEAGNDIHNCTTDAVVIKGRSAVGNAIRRNSFENNGTVTRGIAIDLGGDGTTPNDYGDGDDGPNDLRNWPRFGIATHDGNRLKVDVLGTPELGTVQLYESMGRGPGDRGEAQNYLGKSDVGAGDFELSLTGVGHVGRWLTGTLTDEDGNTSELSLPTKIYPAQDSDGDGAPDAYEDEGPNGGDSNGDGRPDKEQKNVTGHPMPVVPPFVITATVAPLGTPRGTAQRAVPGFTSFRPVGTPAGDLLPDGVVLPHGTFRFEVVDVDAGGRVAVSLSFTGPPILLDSYYAWGAESAQPDDHWYEFPRDGLTGAEITADNTGVVLWLQDGGPGDHDLAANGVIVHTGAPARSANQPPIALNSEWNTRLDEILNPPVPGVLEGAVDPEGDHLAALLATAPQHGTIRLYSDGGFEYTPDDGFTGDDTFTFRAGDGFDYSAEATATITVADIAGTVRFVDASRPDNDGDGLSWTTAYRDLQPALDAGQPGDIVRIAQGTYLPTFQAYVGFPRSVSFVLPGGVALYGGYAGIANPFAPRDPETYETLLSGDIGTPDDSSDNSYSVVLAIGTQEQPLAGIVLDGLTISHGNADGPAQTLETTEGGGLRAARASLALRDVVLTKNRADRFGGGLYAAYGDISMSRVRLLANEAGRGGGGMHIDTAQLDATELQVRGNSAIEGGGGIRAAVTDGALTNSTIADNAGQGILLQNCEFELSNLTIADNQSADGAALDIRLQGDLVARNLTIAGNDGGTSSGGVSASGSGRLQLVNSIVSGNEGMLGEISVAEPAQLVLDHCLVTGWEPPSEVDAVSVSNADPWLEPLHDNGGFAATLGLGADSPAIDAGSIADAAPTDQRGIPRPQGAGVDLGAFETASEPIPWLDIPDGSVDFGPVIVGAHRTVPVRVTGAGLRQNAVLTVEDGDFSVSQFPDGPFGDSTELSPENGLIDTQVFVRYTPAAAGDSPGALSATAFSGAEAGADLAGLGMDEAARYYVRADAAPGGDGLSWATAMRNPQDAILAPTGHGAEVWIAAGTYHPTRDVASGLPAATRAATFWLRNGVAVYGGLAGSEAADYDLFQRDLAINRTVFDGDLGLSGDASDNAYHVLHLTAELDLETTALLDGVVIRNGNADGSALYGGGIRAHEASALFRNVTVEDNGGFRGGGIYVRGGTPVFEDCTVTGNEAYQGGGVYTDHGAQAVFQSCVIADNEAAEGGGLWIGRDTRCSLVEGRVERNRADATRRGPGQGGGCYVDQGVFDCVGTTFAANESAGEGASVYVGDIVNVVKVDLVSSTFDGAVYLYRSGVQATDCTFGGVEVVREALLGSHGCTFSGAGLGVLDNSLAECVNSEFVSLAENGVRVDGGGDLKLTNCLITLCEKPVLTVSQYSSVTATNCTISGNHSLVNSDTERSLAIMSWVSSLEVANSILWGNRGPDADGKPNQEPLFTRTHGGDRISATNSIIEGSGGSSDWHPGMGTDGGGNLDVDPLFRVPADPGTSSRGDLSLGPGSPGVNAGLNEANAEPTDLMGNPRIQHETIDLGAYESAAGAVPWLATDAAEMEFGNVVTGGRWPLELSVFAGNLSGDVMVQAVGPYRIAQTAIGPWVDELALTAAAGGIAADIYVAFEPTASGISAGTLTLTTEGCSDAVVSLQGSGISGIGRYYVREDAPNGGDGSNWGEALRNPQDAVDRAVGNGVEVWVAKGVYRPTWQWGAGPRRRSFRLRNGVAVYGGFTGTEDPDYDLSARNPALNTTVLDGDAGAPEDESDNAYHVFYHPESAALDPTAILDGATITGGRADDTGGGGGEHQHGGGMYNYRCSPLLRRVTFVDNWALHSGGGMYSVFHSFPRMEGCTFRINSAQWGAGLYSEGNAHPVIIDTTFDSNDATEGGGAFLDASQPNTGIELPAYLPSLQLIRCTFRDNYASSGAGGLHIFRGRSDLVGLTFEGNNAFEGAHVYAGESRGLRFIDCTFGPGGPIPRAHIYCDDGYLAAEGCQFTDGAEGIRTETFVDVTLTGCEFRNNYRGVVMGLGSSLQVSHSTFVGQTDGPVISLAGLSESSATNCAFVDNVKPVVRMESDGELELLNCTLAGNHSIPASDTEQALFAGAAQSDLWLRNCIAWDNKGPDAESKTTVLPDFDFPNPVGSVCIAHSLLEGCGGSGASWNSEFGYDVGGNLDADPLFTQQLDAAAATTGDLTPRFISPAVDAGDGTLAVGTTDLNGLPRVVGDDVDLGAYEQQNTSPFGTPAPSQDVAATVVIANPTLFGNPVPVGYWLGAFEDGELVGFEELGGRSDGLVAVPLSVTGSESDVTFEIWSPDNLLSYPVRDALTVTSGSVLGSYAIPIPLGVEAVESILALDIGWNAVSASLALVDPSLSSVLDARHDAVSIVYSWNPDKGSFEPADHVLPGRGYWMFATATGQLVLNGAPIRGVNGFATSGWHFFGVGEVIELGAIVPSRPEQPVGWFWDAAASLYRPVGDNSTLIPGQAYWLHIP